MSWATPTPLHDLLFSKKSEKFLALLVIERLVLVYVTLVELTKGGGGPVTPVTIENEAVAPATRMGEGKTRGGKVAGRFARVIRRRQRKARLELFNVCRHSR